MVNHLNHLIAMPSAYWFFLCSRGIYGSFVPIWNMAEKQDPTKMMPRAVPYEEEGGCESAMHAQHTHTHAQHTHTHAQHTHTHTHTLAQWGPFELRELKTKPAETVPVQYTM